MVMMRVDLFGAAVAYCAAMQVKPPWDCPAAKREPFRVFYAGYAQAIADAHGGGAQ